MLRKLFARKPRVVEVTNRSGQKQVMSEDRFIAQTIEEKRADAELARLGLSARREPDYLVEHVMRRWMM